MRSFKGGEHYVEIVHVDEWSGKKMSLSLFVCFSRKKGIGLSTYNIKDPSINIANPSQISIHIYQVKLLSRIINRDLVFDMNQ